MGLSVGASAFDKALSSASEIVVLSRGLLQGVVAVYLTALIVPSLYYAVYTPAVAWDFLSWWGPEAIAQVSPRAGLGSMDPLTNQVSRHPITLSWLYAVAAQSATFLSEVTAALIVTLSQLTILLVISLYAFRGRLLFVAIFISGLASTPLFYNHILLFGYAEVALSMAVFLVVITLEKALLKPNVKTIIVGLGSLTLPIAIKNTGAIYSLLALVTVTVICINDFSRIRKTFTLLLSALVALLALGQSLPMPLGQTLLFDFDNNRVLVGTYWMAWTNNDPYEVIEAVYTSVFINQSFSTLPITFLLVCLARKHAWGPQARIGRLVTAVTCVAFIASLFIFSRPLETFSPAADTSGSRFLLVMIPVFFYSLIHTVKDMRNGRTILDTKSS